MQVTRSDVNRPGLALSGFFGYFEPGRIQIIGNSEHAYMDTMTKNELRSRIEAFLSRKPVAIIYTTSLEINPVMLELCEKYEVPLLRTALPPSSAAPIAPLNEPCAPPDRRRFRRGVRKGILILGEWRRKSETAIELVKRGHRLIADDGRNRACLENASGSAPRFCATMLSCAA